MSDSTNGDSVPTASPGAPGGRVATGIIRPLVFLSQNWISRFGVVLTTTSAITMVLTYLYEVFGFMPNPYTGILLFLILPMVFVLGLLLIPLGIHRDFRRRRRLGTLPQTYPRVDFSSSDLRYTAYFVVLMTAINVPLFAVASYRGTVYMDSVQFCGLTCHKVMAPEYTAYQLSPHARVACVACHIGPGAPWFVRSKLSGSYQVIATAFDLYPRPIPTPIRDLRPARETCEQCHWPEKFTGDKFIVKTKYADDEKNTATKTVILMHIGGVGPDRKWIGIHGRHLGLVHYEAADDKRQVIPWVSYQNEDGTTSEFVAEENVKTATTKGPRERRLMDCMDCHNRPTHTFEMPEKGLDRIMFAGRLSPNLPYARRIALELLKRNYSSRLAAETELPESFREYYRKNHLAVYNTQRAKIESGASAVLELYLNNIFPEMNVTWGTYPNNLGHSDFPGCFRCHDGNHQTQDGRTISQDCSSCHNLLAMDDPDPKILRQLTGAD